MAIVEHLVVKFEGFLGGKFKSKYHDNLGADLQTALEKLEQEGWEVVSIFGDNNHYPVTAILKRVPR